MFLEVGGTWWKCCPSQRLGKGLGHERWQGVFLPREQHMGSKNLNMFSLAGPWSVRWGAAEGN